MAVAFVLAVGACDTGTVLDVDTPGTLSVDRLQGPENAALLAAGVVGAYQLAIQNHVLYTGLFTDEFILAGTFPTRHEVDRRAVLPRNATVTAYYEGLHRAILQADTTVVQFEAALDDEDFESVLGDLHFGIVAGNLYGGLARTDVAEFWCESPIRVSEPLSSDAIMEQAILKFDAAMDAETRALDAVAAGDLSLTPAQQDELTSLANAARVGKARALLWLERDSEAEQVAQTVPDGFELHATYSEGSTSAFNQVYAFTWGHTQVIRWTVGAGDVGSRFNEEFAYFDEWVTLGRIDPNPDPDDFESFESAVPVRLQQLYDEPGDPILIASKAEADMIEAEVAIREGRFGDAETLVDPYRAEWGLGPMTFTAEEEAALIELAQERNRELWLTSERQETLRRYFERDGIDLYPQGKPGSDICLPVPEQERNNNPNIPTN